MYPELPQDMGEIWPHWVRSVWPQKMGSARLAVLWPRLAKVTIDKVKNVFWLKVIFFKTSIQINFIFVVSNGQSDIAAFCRIFRAFWQINSTASWPTVPDIIKSNQRLIADPKVPAKARILRQKCHLRQNSVYCDLCQFASKQHYLH